MDPPALAAASMISLVLALVPLPAAAQEPGRPADRWTASGAERQTLTVVLPQGDPQAGREAFRALRCAACHGVAEDESSAPKIAAPAPVLGRVQARLEPGRIATAIVSPSHEISPEARPGMEGDASAMPDLSDVLTVRQLVDLVAYVRSLGDG